MPDISPEILEKYLTLSDRQGRQVRDLMSLKGADKLLKLELNKQTKERRPELLEAKFRRLFSRKFSRNLSLYLKQNEQRDSERAYSFIESIVVSIENEASNSFLEMMQKGPNS